MLMSSDSPGGAVAHVLRERIQSGALQAGNWLPTERKLAEDLNVDRRTIRNAINQLVLDGLVVRRPHCRPVVGNVHKKESDELASRASVASTSSYVALLMWSGFGGHAERFSNSQERIFWGMNQALAETGRFAVFVDLSGVGTEPENAAREAEQLRYVLKQGFGGAVFYPYAYRRNSTLVREVCRSIPLVTIDRRIDSVETDFVGVNNQLAMYDLICHLVEQGHKRIAMLTKNERIMAVQDRIQGYIDAIQDAGLEEIVLSIPIDADRHTWLSIDKVFHLPEGQRPTAAAVFNDWYAVDFVQRLQGMGLSVPGDVVVTGFDDIIPVLPNGIGLTTAAQPYEEIGRKAVEVLLRRMKEPSISTVSVHLPAPIIIRESSGRKLI